MWVTISPVNEIHQDKFRQARNVCIYSPDCSLFFTDLPPADATTGRNLQRWVEIPDGSVLFLEDVEWN